jgi:hypothetical protein
MHNGSTRGAHVRGAGVYNIPASASYRFLAALLDLGIGASAFFVVFAALRWIPMPSPTTLSLLLLFVAVTWGAQRFFLGTTLGEKIWGLKCQGKLSFAPVLLQSQPVSATTQSVGIFLTLSSFFSTLAIAYASIALHPVGMSAKATEWEAFFPGFDQAQPGIEKDRWAVMPFFYSLGAWPQSFRGKAVFLNLPYEKGPPERFAGEITARWDSQVRVTFEGPKSPLSSRKELYDRTEIERCVLHLWDSLGTLPHCLSVRSDVLGRHIDALRRVRPSQLSLSWVKVSNKALSPDQQLQGLYISAQNDRRGQDRFVMITARGTHQTFVLDYPVNEIGNAAREDFRNSMRSIRVSDDLAPGRVWVDQSLEKINLRDVTKLGESLDAIQKLAEIQALLIARISVDPKTYDTYFHLAGTALMLGRSAVKLRQFSPPKGNPELAAELLAVAKPTVQTAQHYALDVSPKDKRNALLQNFWAESQKF